LILHVPAFWSISSYCYDINNTHFTLFGLRESTFVKAIFPRSFFQLAIVSIILHSCKPFYW